MRVEASADILFCVYRLFVTFRAGFWHSVVFVCFSFSESVILGFRTDQTSSLS